MTDTTVSVAVPYRLSIMLLVLGIVGACGPMAMGAPPHDPPATPVQDPTAGAVSYDWPVPGPPVRAFDAPATPYGSGHRGVDLPVRAGQSVHPMGDGLVLFAGRIDGDTWVTVSHRDGIVTSYGPLQGRPATTLHRAGGPPIVAVGASVTTMDVLGLARGDAHGTSGRLHVGARRDGRYIDPAGLIADGPPMVATLVGPGQVRADPPTAPDPRLVLVPGTPPSPNHLIVLPGLTSSTGDMPFDLDGLGYGDGTWQQFSYLGVDEDGEPRPYDHEATWGSVHDMAIALEEQMRAHAAEHPGQAVDLMGHSLGGLVAMYYLLVLHDATDPTLPPVGRIATVASPVNGVDSASAVVLARQNPVGALLLDLVEAHRTPPGADGPQMHSDMPVLDDLQVGSPVATAVAEAWQRYREDPWSSPLATGTDVLTIGSTVDAVVNEHRSGLPGAEHVRVTDLDLDLYAHSDVTRDPRTEDALLAFLGSEPLPSGGLTEPIAAAAAGVASQTIAAVEYGIALGTAALSRLLGG